jgi:hypothetical protein
MADTLSANLRSRVTRKLPTVDDATLEVLRRAGVEPALTQLHADLATAPRMFRPFHSAE